MGSIHTYDYREASIEKRSRDWAIYNVHSVSFCFYYSCMIYHLLLGTPRHGPPGLFQIPPPTYQSSMGAIAPVLPTPTLAGSSLSLVPTSSAAVAVGLTQQSSSSNTAALVGGNPVHASGHVKSWTREQIAKFQAELCEVFVSRGWAWSSVQDSIFSGFLSTWIPGCPIPSAEQLSGPILDHAAAQVESSMKSELTGKYATGQCDGWKNVTKASLVASLVTVEGQVNIAFDFTLIQ